MTEEQAVAEQAEQVAITAKLQAMTAALACYLTSAAHQLGMQVAVAASVEILQDTHHLRVLEVQHQPAAVAVVPAAAEVAAQAEIQELQAEQIPVVVEEEVVQVQAATAALVLLFYDIIQKLADQL
jgi:hypothetical protein